jgi:hypothetical protein
LSSFCPSPSSVRQRFSEFAQFNEKLRTVSLENNENERNDNENMAALQSSLPSKHENPIAMFAGSKDKAVQSKSALPNYLQRLTMCVHCCLFMCPLCAMPERRGDLEAYLRRVMFNQQLNHESVVLDFLKIPKHL